MSYNIDKRILTTLCQKCSAPSTKTPMVDFKLSNGLLWIPEFLFCPECGNYVTIQIRDLTEDELKAKEAAAYGDNREVKVPSEIKKVTAQSTADAKIGGEVSDSTA